MPDPIDRDQVRKIFEAACDVPQAEQAAFVKSVAAGNDAIEQEVLSLLRFDALTGTEDEFRQAVHVPENETSPPEQIGPYRIISKIGEGGCGVVYRATQTEPIRRDVAVKLIKPGMDSTSVLRRFELERQALQRMDHPNIARVLDSGVVGSGQPGAHRPYFVMELVDGVRVTEYARRETLGLRDRIRLVLQICAAVQHAHSKGIIHRDLKPSNVLVKTIDGEPCCKVIDFGVAKALGETDHDLTVVTSPGAMIGTPQYMSPEQMRGSADIDTRTDVYALGIILYELLAGTSPFDEATWRGLGLAEMLRQIETTEPQTPSSKAESTRSATGSSSIGERGHARREAGRVPRDLDWITLRAMSKERSRRYMTVAALSDDLTRYLAGEPVDAGPPTVSYKLSKFIARNRALVIASVVAGIGIFVGSGASLWFGVQAERARGLEAEQRILAERKELRYQAINNFLLKDLFRSTNPERLGPEARLVDLVDAAAPTIDERFADDIDMRAQAHYLIGAMYNKTNRYTDAIEHLTTTIELMDRCEEWTELDRSLAHHTRAAASLGFGLLDAAAEDYLTSIAIIDAMPEPNLDERHTRIAGLAAVYQAQEKYDLAEPMLIEAIEYAKHMEPVDVPWLTMTGSIRLTMLGSLGRHDERVEFAAWLRDFAIKHDRPDMALIADMHGIDAIASLGRPDEAIERTGEILEFVTQTFGTESPAYAGALSVSSRACRRVGRLDEAIDLQEQVVDTQARIYGDHHYEVERHTNTLAQYYTEAGREDDFMAARTRGLLLRLHVAGPGEEESVQGITPIGAELVGSRAAWERVVLNEIEQLTAGHYKRARFFANAAISLGARNSSAEGATLAGSDWLISGLLIEAANAIADAERPDEVRRIVLDTLPDLLRREGKPDEAADWQARLTAEAGD